VDSEESGTSTLALNSTLIGMYEQNVLGFMRAHTLIHPDIFVHWRAFCMSIRHVSVGNPRKSLYMSPLVISKGVDISSVVVIDLWLPFLYFI